MSDLVHLLTFMYPGKSNIMVNNGKISFGENDETPIPTENDMEKAKEKWLKAEAMKRVRSQRDHLLSSTDWEVTRALEQGRTPDPYLMKYRQALRDLPNDTINCNPSLDGMKGFIEGVDYPIRES